MCAPSLCQDEQLDTQCTELNLSQLSDKLEKIQQAHSWRPLLTQSSWEISRRNIREETIQSKHLI